MRPWGKIFKLKLDQWNRALEGAQVVYYISPHILHNITEYQQQTLEPWSYDSRIPTMDLHLNRIIGLLIFAFIS